MLSAIPVWMAANEAATVERPQGLSRHHHPLEAELFVNGARGAELPDRVPADVPRDMPN